MKQFFALLLAALLLAGCAGKAPAETTAATEAPPAAPETTAATEPATTEPPVPETEKATVLADRTEVVLAFLDMGDTLTVMDSDEEAYYTVKLENGYGLVEKRLVRVEEEASGNASVLAENVPVLHGWFSRGEAVALVRQEGFAGEADGYAAVLLDGRYGYVRRNLIAPEGEGYVPWEGYAVSNAAVYDNYDLTGKPTRTLALNEPVTVEWDLGNCYLVTLGNATGYMAKEQVSQFRTATDSTAPTNGNNGPENSGDPGDEEWTPPVL